MGIREYFIVQPHNAIVDAIKGAYLGARKIGGYGSMPLEGMASLGDVKIQLPRTPFYIDKPELGLIDEEFETALEMARNDAWIRQNNLALATTRNGQIKITPTQRHRNIA